MAAYSPPTPSGVTSPSRAAGSAKTYNPTIAAANGHRVSPAPRSEPVTEPSIPSGIADTAATTTNVAVAATAAGPSTNTPATGSAAATTAADAST